jgi:Flp pilus assembly protein TadD
MTSDEELTLMLRLLGHFYMQSNRPAKAATLYRALALLEPADANAAKALAWAHLSNNHAEHALDVLDGIVGANEPSPEVHLMRSQALTRLARLEDAQVSMRAYLATRGGRNQSLGAR